MASNALKSKKLGYSLMNTLTRRAIIGHKVLAALEHSEAIRFTDANTLIDVGANKGQFSLAFRFHRKSAKIIAFEPLSNQAEIMARVFNGDRDFEIQQVAISEITGTAEFHVADRADSSSLLRIGQNQSTAFNVKSNSIIQVKTTKLDEVVNLSNLAHPVLLKVDVQGAELLVFKGISDWSCIDYVYVELSFVELYEGQALFPDVYDYLYKMGFVATGFFNQVSTLEFGPTQVDVLFKNSKLNDRA